MAILLDPITAGKHDKSNTVYNEKLANLEKISNQIKKVKSEVEKQNLWADTIEKYGFHTQIEEVKRIQRDKYMRQYMRENRLLSDMYFQIGKAYFRKQMP